jgi:hypothetical protein
VSDEEQYTIDIPAQIYNVLIHENIISDVTENVIIYSLNKKCEIIIIQHVKNPNNNRFSRNNLETFFEVLLDASIKNSYIIVYDYENSYYKTFHTNSAMSIPRELRFINTNIVNIITLKPIN